jgi:rhodanese-related sulfurtransferase
MKKCPYLITLILLLALLSSCGAGSTAVFPAPLPSAEPDTGSMFGVDKNINISSIDSWLGREDVAYRDVRMLFDPADYAAIGGDADLTRTIEGFKVVPYPFIATLSALPVSGAYAGDCLFAVTWGSDGAVVSAEANYAESMMILEELFPKDKSIFLMCGGGGYSGMMKTLLIFLGWDAARLYNIGANWSYTGAHSLELIVYPEDAGGDTVYATWRADYVTIDFSRLHQVTK